MSDVLDRMRQIADRKGPDDACFSCGDPLEGGGICNGCEARLAAIPSGPAERPKPIHDNIWVD